MKTLKYLSLLALVIIAFTSCSKGPEDYNSQIQDAVKFTISSHDAIIYNSIQLSDLCYPISSARELEQYNELKHLIFNVAYPYIFEKLDSLSNKENEFPYFEAMNKYLLSDLEYKREVQGLLKFYNEKHISLTGYQLNAESDNYKSWNFEELKTKIPFVFTIANINGIKKWVCKPSDAALTRYLEDLQRTGDFR